MRPSKIPGIQFTDAGKASTRLHVASLHAAEPEQVVFAGVLTGRIRMEERSSWLLRARHDQGSAIGALAALPYNHDWSTENIAQITAATDSGPVAAVTVPPPPPAARPALPTKPITPAALHAASQAADQRTPESTLPTKPAVTASGIDPAVLATVPNVFARKAIADEPDWARAYAMLQEFSGPGGAQAAEIAISRGHGRIADVAAAARQEVKAAATKAHEAFRAAIRPH